MHSYLISGLSVQSEIALPGLIDTSGDAVHDVTIAQGPVPAALDDVMAHGPTWSRGKRQFLLTIPGVARYLLDDGERITVDPIAGSAGEDVALFLAGNVFGILLHQRGQIVLHASAIAVGTRAVLFCGSSGAGKSTLAAALGQHGYRFVADDQCAVTTSPGTPPTITPDGRLLKLWAHATDGLAISERRGAAMRGRIEKYYVEPHATSLAPMPVGAIYMLAEARGGRIAGIAPVNIADAARLITANAYRPVLVHRMGQRAAYFHASAVLAANAGVHTLTRPLGFAAMPETIGWLEAHWAAIGLAEPAG